MKLDYMNYNLEIIFLLLFSISTALYSQTKSKANYNYLLTLPNGYSEQSKEYPLVIYLHGGSQKGNDLNKLKAYGLPYLIDKGHNFEFIIASPQCPDSIYWSTENWFDSLYLDLKSKYRIDTSRIYLTGFSMGGYGVYIAAMDFPDTFAALLPLNGGCNDSDTTRICNLKDIPIWAFHGSEDKAIPIQETERIANALNICGGNMKFTRLEGRDHMIVSLYETNPEIFEWMLNQKKIK